MWLPILITVAALLVVLIIVIAMQPARFKITRSTMINASPASVFGHVNDLHKWEAWSPWAKMDPNCKMDYAGAPAGAGATMHWSGNNKVGEGRMTITSSRPSELVGLKLDFLRPFKATN